VSRRRDERGAIAALTALTLVIVVAMTSFAVDLGMQRVVRSDMQALADVVALDAARLLDGRTAGDIRAGDAEHASLSSVVAASVARNDDTLGQVDGVDAVLIYLDTDTDGAYTPLRNGAGALVAVPDAAVPDAVYVQASGSVEFAFRVGSGGAQRSAIAAAVTAACFELGSFAASVDPANSTLFGDMLEPLLGHSVVTAVGYQGLASADVSLLDVLSAPSLGIGTVDGVLSAPMVKLGDFYLAMAYALNRDGDTVSAQLLQVAAVSAVASQTIDLGQMFALTTATDDVLDTRFNVLDLLVGSAFLADGEHLVGIPNLQAGLPSIGVTNVDLSVIERAQRACGDDTAETAQVSLTALAKLQLAIPIVKTPVIDLSLVGSDGKPSGETILTLDTFLAGAHGNLTDIACSPDTFDADVWSELVRLSLTGRLTLSGTVKVDITVLGVPLVGVTVPVKFGVNVSADASQPAGASATAVTYQVPPLAYGTPVTTGTTAALPHVTLSLDSSSVVIDPVKVKVGLITVTLSAGDLLGSVTPLLNTAVTSVSGTVAPLVNPLVDKVNLYLAQLADGLGITVAGADFFGLPYPQCSSPRLRD
jgi:uncharacterized membrane protein